MKNIIVIATLFLSMQSIFMFGQVERQNGLSITIKGPNTKIEGVKAEDASAKTQHLRFLTEDYQEAKVDALKNTFYFRYNIFEDEIEFIKDGKIYFLSKTENQIINFINLNRIFTVQKLDGKLQYLEINYKGKKSLYTKQRIEFKEGQVAKTQFETSKKAKFIQNKDINYITKNNDDLVKLPKGKKDFYAIFDNQSSIIKKYMKKEKLNRKKIKDVVRILKYYNSL